MNKSINFLNIYFFFYFNIMKCAKCGSVATTYNKNKIPTCSRHINEKIISPNCPNCGSLMIIRKSKYGSFWGCSAYPMCEGIKKI